MNPEEELSKRLTALTRDLVLIPSTDTRFEERARCFEFVQNHLDALDGIELRFEESNGYTSLLALPDSHSNPEILLCGHLDVVEHPGLPAYRSTIENGCIRGPGTGDMKGQLAILLELFREFHTEHPGLSLGLAVTSDEEQGGENGVRYLVEEAGLRCGIVIIPEKKVEEVVAQTEQVLRTESLVRKAILEGVDPQEAVSTYHCANIPQLVIIDAAGLVRRVHIGFRQDIGDVVSAEIEAMLAE